LTQLALDPIEPKNPPWWRVLENGEKIVTRIGHFSNRWLADLRWIAELTA
jgi:hypothetical protein